MLLSSLWEQRSVSATFERSNKLSTYRRLLSAYHSLVEFADTQLKCDTGSHLSSSSFDVRRLLALQPDTAHQKNTIDETCAVENIKKEVSRSGTPDARSILPPLCPPLLATAAAACNIILSTWRHVVKRDGLTNGAHHSPPTRVSALNCTAPHRVAYAARNGCPS